MAEQPETQPATTQDDIVLPFQTVASKINGRLVRLGGSIDEVLQSHDYPTAVSEALGQAVALVALLGSSLKFDGKLILQTNTTGPLNLIVVNFETPGSIRAYARYDQSQLQKLSAAQETLSPRALLGEGHLVMTIDPQGEMDRYQGIVAIDKDGLVGAALSYFRQSEQLPTFIRLAVARHFQAGEKGRAGSWQWRAGGLQLQHLTSEGGKRADDELTPEMAAKLDEQITGEDDDDWQRVRLLAETVEDHELLDPMLAPERLVYRLFHEEGVRVTPARQIKAHCPCSRERVAGFLSSFGADELSDMRDDSGALEVTCEFCSNTYRFSLDEVEQSGSKSGSR